MARREGVDSDERERDETVEEEDEHDAAPASTDAHVFRSESPPAAAAGQSANPAADPAADPRARYEYTGGNTAQESLVTTLRERIEGDVRFDEYSRQLYATDASAYEVTPIGVVYPTSTQDVAAVVTYCAERDIPVLPRGGGTSLAGQAVNEAVVLDFTRYMDAVHEVDPDEQTATAQPGVLLGDLNETVAEHGLKFAPDPAWGDKSTLGGAIGNNSTGSHSLQYGKTDVYIEECEVVLADGTVTSLREMSLLELRQKCEAESARSPIEVAVYETVLDLLEDREKIRAAFPDLKRNVSGYNFDRLVAEADADDSVNLARLLAGSEGTLAIVTKATVSLEPIPPTKAMALLRYETLQDAMADVASILEHDPAAVEVLDDVLLEMARETEAFGDLVDSMIPEGTGAVLLVEFYATDEGAGKQYVADLLAGRIPTAIATAVPREGAEDISAAPPRAVGADEAHDEGDRERFWKLRKSGLPILLSRTSDAKHISFIEDVAVEPADLPAFVEDFQAVLDEHDTFASFYGHAGPGCLHIRPLVNTKTDTGIAQMAGIAEAVTDLAVEYGGSVSGEHGDGRARTQFNSTLYGQDLWERFRDLKTAFDPDWLLNPGQVCGYDPEEALEGAPTRARTVQLTEELRFSPDYEFDLGFEPQLRWEDDNGMQGMVELCHGCGGCRGLQSTTGKTMCPTYRAANEEITSTRGRANALRQAMSGDLPAEPTDDEFATEVLDLCIGCKGCKHDCPSGVDMAKLKAEVTYQRHQDGRPSIRDRLFANVDRVSAIGSKLAPLPALLQRLPGSNFLQERVLGIANERDLPPLQRESFETWWASREPRVSREDARGHVLLFPDTYTNYSHPEVGKAAVQVLEALDFHVEVPSGVTASGRAAFSKGFLDLARERAQQNVDVLAPAIADGWDVLVIEPSDAVMFQADYLDLLTGPEVERVATQTFGVCEYLDRADVSLHRFEGQGSLTYHGHCHQKATERDRHAVSVLQAAGYEVDNLDSGCCGMAGSFGYEAEHYSMSRAIGRILARQLARSPGQQVVAPGASCRSQIADVYDTTDDGIPGLSHNDSVPPHPIEALAAAIPETDR